MRIGPAAAEVAARSRASTSSAVGSGLRSISAAAAIVMPGVQKPHCIASWSMNACLHRVQLVALGETLDRRDLRARRLRPPASCRSRCGAPSSQTVQAEQAPRLQAILVPVSPSGPRNASASVMRGSTRRAPVDAVDVQDDVPRGSVRRACLGFWARGRSGQSVEGARPDRRRDRPAEQRPARHFRSGHVAVLALSRAVAETIRHPASTA